MLQRTAACLVFNMCDSDILQCSRPSFTWKLGQQGSQCSIRPVTSVAYAWHRSIDGWPRHRRDALCQMRPVCSYYSWQPQMSEIPQTMLGPEKLATLMTWNKCNFGLWKRLNLFFCWMHTPLLTDTSPRVVI
jgi:hypothetical protein